MKHIRRGIYIHIYAQETFNQMDFTPPTAMGEGGGKIRCAVHVLRVHIYIYTMQVQICQDSRSVYIVAYTRTALDCRKSRLNGNSLGSIIRVTLKWEEVSLYQ